MEVWWPPIKVYFTPFINMKLRVFEAFAGVGSQRMALRNLGIEHEVVAIAEIDKFAIKSYEAIHGETNNLGDISQIETADIPDHDLFTYSFPCQDISVAGKGLGLDEGSDTRSGLLWECQKVIAGKKPKYLLLENVKNLVGKKHKRNFDKWLEWLEEQGYTNYWEVLNAKDYGIPQNRERVFVVSILGEHEPYEFPEPIELELRLKDVLESEVDEKFYLDQERVDKLIVNSDKLSVGYIPRTNGTQHQSNTIYKTDAESPSMQARDYKDPVKVLIENAANRISEPKIEQVAQYDTPTRKNSNRFRTYDKRGISPSITTMGGGGLGPHVMLNGTESSVETNDNKDIFIGASRGRNPKNPSDRTVGSPTEQRLEINKQGTSNTITTVQKDNYVVERANGKNAVITKSPADSDGIDFVGYLDGNKRIKNPTEDQLKLSRTHRQPNRIHSDLGIHPSLSASEVSGRYNVAITNKDDSRVVEPLGTLAAHNSDKFGTGYMDGVSKTLKANKHDISVVERVTGMNKLDKSEDPKKTESTELVSDVKYMTDIQEKMMLTDDEWEYGVLKQELFDKFGTSRVCTRCKSQVIHSDLPNYDYLCFECDENLYEFETENTHFLVGSTQRNAGVTDGDYTTTLTSSMGTGGGHVPMHNLTSDYRIRKLTPLECWRLMGFSDEDFHKAEEVNSNSQLYKQAGNSIVVDVLEGIFKQLLEVAE